jgi:hypothetical protein
MVRSCRRRSENDRGGGIEVLPTVVFADAKHVQANLIGVFDLFDQVAQTVRVDCKACVVVCRCEAIDANLHPCLAQLRDHFVARSLLLLNFVSCSSSFLHCEQPEFLQRAVDRFLLLLGQG